MNKTSCTYVNSAVNSIYSTYCPADNTIAMLFYDCYVWVFISFGLACMAWIMLLLWEIIAKAYVKGTFDTNIV